MAVEFSDTTPAPPAGAVNVKWQWDAGTAKASAYVVAGGSGGTWTWNPTLTDSGDHKNFGLPASPLNILVVQNGLVLKPGTDYTVAGATLTLTTAIVPGTDVLWAPFMVS